MGLISKTCNVISYDTSETVIRVGWTSCTSFFNLNWWKTSSDIKDTTENTTNDENICKFAFGNNVVYLRASLYFSEYNLYTIRCDGILWRLDEFSHYNYLIDDFHIKKLFKKVIEIKGVLTIIHIS